jgi:hypothetical protein
MTEVSTRPSGGATKHLHVEEPPLPKQQEATPRTVTLPAPFASAALSRASEAEAVLRTVAEDGSKDAANDAVWGVMTILGIVLNDLERIQNQPSVNECQYVVCHMEQAIGILSLLKGDTVLNATSTLLQASLATLVKEMGAQA